MIDYKMYIRMTTRCCSDDLQTMGKDSNNIWWRWKAKWTQKRKWLVKLDTVFIISSHCHHIVIICFHHYHLHNYHHHHLYHHHHHYIIIIIIIYIRYQQSWVFFCWSHRISTFFPRYVNSWSYIITLVIIIIIYIIVIICIIMIITTINLGSFWAEWFVQGNN